MHQTLSCAISLLVLGLLQGNAPPSPPPVQGHLVLVVQGDANGLTASAVVPKPDAWAGVPKDLESRYHVAVLAGNGVELGRYPLDLTHFDLDPTRVGTGPKVEGCQVVETRVTMLASVPRFRDAAALRFLRDGRPFGEVGALAFTRMLDQGERR